ncbi:aminotransferase class III-fold pyridoxal phosphate-dependent enzyme [Nocardioides sp.]|uniref:aspartate aminotransferase family protein n=1 Tax=Nocardioides sp. TaxID=35761 RepID=UPI003D10B5F2
MDEIDPVLLADPPTFTGAEAAALAGSHFALEADSGLSLGSERDQTFLLSRADAGPVGVLKVSNAAESTATLDMEALVVRHIARVDPELAVARPLAHRDAGDLDDPASYRAEVAGARATHWARLYPVMPGRMRSAPSSLDDRAVIAWGATTARLARAMRGFSHPSAHRALPWDLKSVPMVRGMVPAIRRPEWRVAVEQALDRYDATIAPRWESLRAQVVHGDLNIDNALVDDAGLITGIIDFGDMSHTALITDLASVIDSLVLDRGVEEAFRVARLVLDGYQQVTPLESDELVLISDAWAARAAAGIAIASWRSAEGLEDPEFAERDLARLHPILQGIIDTGFEESAARVSGLRRPPPRDDLIRRRAEALGPAMEPLTYDEPLYVERASGVWMYDADGTRYLDAYNNVPCVGHAHPRVTEAIARQARTVNTHLRYLHGDAIELAERLIASCPPGLDTVLFVNSGSEANDLAWRLATHVTGRRGALCTHFAYHGISEAIAALSPETLYAGQVSEHVERWRPADAYRGLHLDAGEFSAALARLEAKSLPPAAVILDGVMQSDGVLTLTAEHVADLARRTREAGALWIADEVQGGHGRTGESMWSFQRFGIEPDFVTLGKPMGNGHPVAAVITRREYLEGFADDSVIFSTFGGNPVSAAAGLAVLDVLADECVLPRVVAAGEALRAGLVSVTADLECVGDVRGVGLANGIEIVTDRASKQPDARTASRIKESMKRHGVLVGTTGPEGNVLKVRPPLAFTEREVPVFVGAFLRAVAEVGDRPGVTEPGTRSTC